MRGLAPLAGVLLACASAAPPPISEPYRPTRRDYASFAAAWPDLYDPNYLPFMLHRLPDGPEGDLLFFCRWDAAAMPLRVAVPAVVIPEELQDEFWPRASTDFEAAVIEALDVWERELEGLVRFEGSTSSASADLIVRLVAAQAPLPDAEHTLLGRTRLHDACSVRGLDREAERFDVRFRVAELEIFLADQHGLLAVDQIHRIALHELGHALGMRGHSPIPADVMYEVVRDRLQVQGGLSPEDVNSFVSMYRLPNGAIYGRATPGAQAPMRSGPGPPQLSMAPYVDARHGYRLRLPDGWTHFGTQHGVVGVDGVTWDYRASIQVAVQRYATVDGFLERYGAYYLSRGAVAEPIELRVDGRVAYQSEIVLREAPRVEQVTLVEVGDGRILVITADCPRGEIDAYRPWFDAVLATLRISDLPEDAWPGSR